MTGDDDRSLLRRTAAWAWDRDEVGEEATAETVRYTGVMYSWRSRLSR